MPMVAFDVDGTLVDSARGVIDALHATIDDLGLPTSDQPGPWAVGPPTGDNMRRLFGSDISDETVERAVERYSVHYKANGLDHTTLFPGMLELLDELRSHDVTLTVVTAKTTAGGERTLSHFGIRDRFAGVYGSTSSGLPTKGELLARALVETGKAAERAVMVGDRVFDVEAGRTNNVWTCAVTYGYEDDDALVASGPDAMVRSVDELRVAVRTRLALG